MELTESADFETEVKEGVVLVDFHATWCGPCRALAPILEDLTDVKILKVNVDDHSELSGALGVTAMPTLLFFKNGEQVEKIQGVQPREALQAKVDELNA